MTTHYLSNRASFDRVALRGGSARWVEVKGRAGLLGANRGTRAMLPSHPLNAPRGTASLWFCALDDLANVPWAPTWIDACHPGHRNYPLLCDDPGPDIGFQAENATFVWNWDNDWYPQFYAKFYRGRTYPDSADEVTGDRAFVGAGHWAIRRHEWYCLGLTWDKPCNDYRLYINGLCVARSDERRPATYGPVSTELFVGDPAFLVGEVKFEDTVCDARQLQAQYVAGGGDSNSALNRELRHRYAGEGNARLPAFDARGWSLAADLPLRQPEDMARLYVQGPTDAPRITTEGLRITTPLQRQVLGVTPGWSAAAANLGRKDPNADPLTPSGFFDRYAVGASDKMPIERLAPAGTFREGEPRDMEQVYVWLRDWFEGDIHVEYEFMPLRQEGLSLIMVQCAGMHREDFMVDDPPRTNGSMRTVCWENVRNYHWEYYRNILDCRRDLASHVLVKNPRSLPLAMGYQQPLRLHQWHKLVFHQDENHLIGSIDEEVVIEAHDNPFFGQGPINNCGHIAIRCMIRSDLLVRNLKVWTSPPVTRAVAQRGTTSAR